ncbi:hypothetical protein AB0C42_28120 [Micromonospora taraxaci]
MGPVDDLPLPQYVTTEDVMIALRAVTVHAPARCTAGADASWKSAA